LFTGSNASFALGLGTITAGAFVQGYQAGGVLTSNLSLQPSGGRTLVANQTDNGLDAFQVNGGMYATGLKINTGNQAIGKIWMGNNSNGAGDWSSNYVSSVNGSNGAITGVIMQNGNAFGTNISIGSNDNWSVFTKINGTNVGGFSNQMSGGAFLVGTAVYDASSGMRLQVNGGIKATTATYTTGGYTYTLRNSSTGNLEATSTLPLLDTRLKRRQISDANTTVNSLDYMVEYTALTADRQVQLPNANTMTDMVLYIKNRTSSLNNIVVKPFGVQTIDGAGTHNVQGEWKCKAFYSDGSNWYTMSDN
jgi:hypothetical protein